MPNWSAHQTGLTKGHVSSSWRLSWKGTAMGRASWAPTRRTGMMPGMPWQGTRRPTTTTQGMFLLCLYLSYRSAFCRDILCMRTTSIFSVSWQL